MSRDGRTTLFWRFQILGWVLFALGAFPVKLAAYPALTTVAILTLTREPLGFLLTCGLRFYYRRLHRRAIRNTRITLIIIFASAILGAVDTLFGHFVNEWIGYPEEPTFTLGVFCFRGTLYLTWSFLYFWIKTLRAEQDRAFDLARAETSRREAELQLLRAQVNPHFLFNALNTILATLEPGQVRAQRVVEGLATYLRYSLQHRADSLVPLGAEYDAALSYLAVERERYRDELVADCSIDDAARIVPVPGVLLQPLLENALKYSRQTSEPPYRVALRVTAPTDAAVTIEVANTGTWIEPTATPGPHGTGLANLRHRLALLYPDRHRLETSSTDDGWVHVRLHLSAGADRKAEIAHA